MSHVPKSTASANHTALGMDDHYEGQIKNLVELALFACAMHYRRDRVSRSCCFILSRQYFMAMYIALTVIGCKLELAITRRDNVDNTFQVHNMIHIALAFLKCPIPLTLISERDGEASQAFDNKITTAAGNNLRDARTHLFICGRQLDMGYMWNEQKKNTEIIEKHGELPELNCKVKFPREIHIFPCVLAHKDKWVDVEKNLSRLMYLVDRLELSECFKINKSDDRFTILWIGLDDPDIVRDATTSICLCAQCTLS